MEKEMKLGQSLWCVWPAPLVLAVLPFYNEKNYRVILILLSTLSLDSTWCDVYQDLISNPCHVPQYCGDCLGIGVEWECVYQHMPPWSELIINWSAADHLSTYLENGFVVNIRDSLIDGVLPNVTLSRMVTYYRVTCCQVKAYCSLKI